MAIVVDPNLLARTDVIFGTASQLISIYPIGETENNGAGVEFIDVWVATTGTIESVTDFSGVATPVTAGDVVAIQNDVDAGHYYVQAISTNTLTLADIDTGTAGAPITSLTVDPSPTFDGSDVTVGTDQITVTAHGYLTGDAVVLRGTTLPTELTTNTVYYVIRIDANEIQLATTYALAVAGTQIDLITANGGTGHTLDARLIVSVFNNGASASENIGGLDTSGDADGDVLDGITQQAIYSFGKEEWRVDSQVADVLSNSYNDDLIRHEFPFEAITSEQFEVGGGSSHDGWNWFNLYTRKKVRTAGWAEKDNNSVNDLARHTGIITLGSLDSDAQVYYQQVSIVTTKADFTFLGPVNESLQVQRDDDQDLDFLDGSDFDRTTFLKLFVRKKGRSYSTSTIADIGVTTIQTIVNRFPLAHVVDTAITLTDANLFGLNPYKFATAPVSFVNDTDGIKTINQLTLTNTGATDFAAAGVVPGDILEITSVDADTGFYEIVTVATVTITIKELESVSGNDFTFQTTGWNVTDSGATAFSIYTSLLRPEPAKATDRDTGVLIESIADTLVDIDGVTGTLTDAAGAFTATNPTAVAAGDILIISQFYDLSFDAATGVDDSTERVTVTDHNLRTGDRMIYDENSGGNIVPLVDGDVYYASVFDSNDFFVCATLDDAWARANGDSTELDLTDGTGTQLFHVHEGDGCYPIDTVVSGTELTLDTTDQQFPSTSKTAGTFYTVVEAGMYLQFKDKTVNQQSQTQTTLPLTDLNFVVTGGPTYTIDITGGSALGFDYEDDTGSTVSVQSGDMLEFTGTTLNDGRYTVLSRTDAQTVVVREVILADTADHVGVTIDIKRGFERTLGADDVSFNWKVSGNGGTLQNVFEFVQSELRSDETIDCGAGTFVPATNSGLVGFVGDINDLLMSFASPTGTGLNMFIDDLASNDINNATFNDHAGNAQNFPFTAAGSLVFNPNLTNDSNSNYWLFFSNDDAGDNLGRDYGTENAIIVDSSTDIPIFGSVNGTQHSGGIRSVDSGTTSITFTYAFATNAQRGVASLSTVAPVTLIAIGAPTAQFVIATGNITQAVGITISAVAALERNYNGSL